MVGSCLIAIADGPCGTNAALPSEGREQAHGVTPLLLYHYVVIRNDLPDGIREAQVVHAAGESAAAYAVWSGQSLSKATRSVVLAVPSQIELQAVLARLRASGLPFSAIVESEGAYAGQLMAIGCTPCPAQSRTRKVLSDLPLYRRKEAALP